jgi:hypothetical protein
MAVKIAAAIRGRSNRAQHLADREAGKGWAHKFVVTRTGAAESVTNFFDFIINTVLGLDRPLT